MDYSAARFTQQPSSFRRTPENRSRTKLATALGVERGGLDAVLRAAHGNLVELRALGLAEMSALARRRDAERIFYLVQWERLQAHLRAHGELPEPGELEPLLALLNPIFERHFSRNSRFNETLLSLYRAALSSRGEETYLTPHPPSPARRLLTWLGFSTASERTV